MSLGENRITPRKREFQTHYILRIYTFRHIEKNEQNNSLNVLIVQTHTYEKTYVEHHKTPTLSMETMFTKFTSRWTCAGQTSLANVLVAVIKKSQE